MIDKLLECQTKHGKSVSTKNKRNGVIFGGKIRVRVWILFFGTSMKANIRLSAATGKSVRLLSLNKSENVR